MVNTSSIIRKEFSLACTVIGLTLLLAAPLSVLAQNYSSTDTVTEYPNKGTFYHDRFEGRKTANGEIFDQNKFTAAHWKIKLGTMVIVTNQNTGLQVLVKVNDRCPKRGVFDLSHRAANAIGIRGCQPVTVRILPDGYEERWAAQDAMFDSVHSRLAGNIAASQPPAPTAKAETKAAPTTPKQANPQAKTQNSGTEYNIRLCYVKSHGDAYYEIQKLPKAYHNKVTIDPIDDNGMLCLTLDVTLSQSQATDLRRALLHSFPDAEVVAAE